MGEDSRWRVLRRGQDAVGEARSALDEILREGARRMLQEAIEVEVADGKVTNAWSSGQMFRGIELILQGRDPRDAHHFVQRSCGV